MIQTDIAYAAGLFEGEGSSATQRNYFVAGIKRLRKTPQRMLQLRMTDEFPVLEIQRIFGGKVYGPYNAAKGTKPYWAWNLYEFEKVQAAIAAMWKYLSPRRRAQLKMLLIGSDSNSVQIRETTSLSVGQRTGDS